MDSCVEYFATQAPPPGLDHWKDVMEEFVGLQKEAGRPVALISSGGTTVPLEHQMVRFLDNFSAGTRGSASAEYFLEKGYAVIFLHRNFSLEPYSRHYSHTIHCILDLLEIVKPSGEEIIAVQPQQQEMLKEVLVKHNRARDGQLLLKVPFVTVTEYLFLLRMASQALHAMGPNALFYLAAAVSDFFVPDNEMPQHKIQSIEGELVLTLKPVPKMLSPLCREWCPDAFIVSFKLETDESLLEAKARASLKKYGHELVIGNLLHTRKHTVKFVTQNAVEDITLSPEERDPKSGVEIEMYIVGKLISLHEAFAARVGQNRQRV